LIACNAGCTTLACKLMDKGLSLNEDVLKEYADPKITKEIEEYNKTTTIQWVYDGESYKIQCNPGESFQELQRKISEELDISLDVLASKFEIYIGDTYIVNNTALQYKLNEFQHSKGPIHLTIRVPFELHYKQTASNNDSHQTKTCRFFMTMDNKNKADLFPALQQGIFKNSPQNELNNKSKFKILESDDECLIDQSDDVRDFIEANGTTAPFKIDINYTK